jgi:hypothetical protein
MNGKRGMGVATPIMAYSLEDALQLAAGFFTIQNTHSVFHVVQI